MTGNEALNGQYSTVLRTGNRLVREKGMMTTSDESAEMVPVLEDSQRDLGAVAYELLLLEQRLAAYERLHLEEISELRCDIERLRRVFLQQTSAHRVSASDTQP